MILQGPTNPKRVLEELAALLADPAVERLRVAVAYANPGGVRALRALLDAADNLEDVEIVVTLDMGITRKAALELLLHEFEGSVRVVMGGSGAGTFHAKAFVVDRIGSTQRALVGSANLTDAAFNRNREAISVGELAAEETASWEAWWDDLVAGADDLTKGIIDGYVERRPARGRRERIADEDVETTEAGTTVIHRHSEIGAESAEWLVIDWGGTGEYRVQAEFPKVAAAFFHPGEDARDVTIQYAGEDYRDNQLNYYPDNGMARINLDGDIPVVADESIKDETSLFTRLDEDRYELRLVEEAERARLLAEGASSGGYDNTRRHDGPRREFGWV